MTISLHHARQAPGKAESIESLVDLLVGYVDQAYVTAEQPGALSAVREIFGKMDRTALAGLVHELGLETEPVREHEGGERRPPEIE